MYRYKTLEAWKRAHAAAVDVLRTTDRPCHPRTREVFNQLRRAVVSIEANIVEGYALGSRGHYLRHVRIALGSAAECECLIRLAIELGYLSPADVAGIEESLAGAMKTLAGILRRGAPPISS